MVICDGCRDGDRHIQPQTHANTAYMLRLQQMRLHLPLFFDDDSNRGDQFNNYAHIQAAAYRFHRPIMRISSW